MHDHKFALKLLALLAAVPKIPLGSPPVKILKRFFKPLNGKCENRAQVECRHFIFRFIYIILPYRLSVKLVIEMAN